MTKGTGPAYGGPHGGRGKGPRDPDIAFMLEVVAGIAGFLGAGWLYAGHPRRTALLMVSWWGGMALLVTALVLAARTAGLIGILGALPAVMTVGVGVPLLSGFRVRRQLLPAEPRARASESEGRSE